MSLDGHILSHLEMALKTHIHTKLINVCTWQVCLFYWLSLLQKYSMIILESFWDEMCTLVGKLIISKIGEREWKKKCETLHHCEHDIRRELIAESVKYIHCKCVILCLSALWIASRNYSAKHVFFHDFFLPLFEMIVKVVSMNATATSSFRLFPHK